MKIKYRPEIDGLRAIAVFSVIFYHADIIINNSQIFSGGFIGVDIFFVISGYLITSIILKELIKTGFFSFINFYERRIRRLLPALLFVVSLSLPFAWIYLYPIDLVDFSKSILYALGFSSNFYFHYSGLEYGSPESILKPFLHTWSLSVEEQYYILFPIILLVSFRYFKKYIFYILLFGLISSLVLADWSSKNYPSINFYFISTRMWELIFGSMLAYYELKLNKRGQNNNLNQLYSLIGLLLILYSIIFFDDKMFHPSFYTLIPVAGVSLVLWFTSEKELIVKILSNKLLVGAGLISYSLYLWHYVIFSFAKNLDIYFEQINGKVILIILTILLSVFTYFLIERPGRKIKPFKIIFSILLLFIFLISIFSVSVILKKGFVNRIKVQNYQEKHTYSYLTDGNKICFNRFPDFCKFGSSEKKIILLGDSQFGSLAFDLYDKIKTDYTFYSITNGGYFHLRENKLQNKHTKKINKSYDLMRGEIDKILNESKNNIIILGGATSLYLYNKRVPGRSLHWDFKFVNKDTLEYDRAGIEEDFKNLVKDLSSNNEIILVYPIPEIGRNLQKKKFENMVRVFNYKYSDFLKQNNEVINFFDSISFPKVHKVYPHKLFCSSDTDLCLTHNEEHFFFFDGFHPSLEGSKMINNLIMNKINEIKLN
jgi:peptidoglycan/LPS O-acetylase OafA/YrhL